MTLESRNHRLIDSVSNPHPPKRLSIKDVGGIIPYLNLPHIVAGNNGLNGHDFEQRVDLGVSNTKIAQDFGKAPLTIKGWKNRLTEDRQ